MVKKKKTGWGSQPKAAPLSVEDILRKKREAEEAASKVRLGHFSRGVLLRDVYAKPCRIRTSAPTDHVGTFTA